MSERISEYNDRIEALAHHSYPQVALLKQIKGVGTLIALTFLLTLEGAQYILGPFGVDCDLRRWGLKLAERGGKSGKKRAIIATARKLAVFAASPLGERRSLRTVAQEHANDSGSRVRQNATKSKPFQEEESKKTQSRVPMTALIAWLRFTTRRVEPWGAKQMASPAVTRTPNLHRANRIAPRECEWKHGDSGHSAGEKNLV